MRVTQSMYYNNITNQNSKLTQELFDVNRQIASGHKIQYAHEDADVFNNTMRLDNEVTTLTQAKNSTQNGYKFSTQTDTTISEMSMALDTFKVKLINAGSDTHSPESLDAVANELEGIRNHLVQLSNTSINGNYIFSGTASSVKPITETGEYLGNDGTMTSFLGSNVEQQYNISGDQMFLGEESRRQRNITTNVGILDKTQLYPTTMSDSLSALDSTESYISENSTIRDLVGDDHTQKDIDLGIENYKTTHFYIRGTDHEGDSFKQRVEMNGSQSVGELLDKIGEAYGNTTDNTVVTTSINNEGQIEILDKRSGSSSLDFHIVGATDFDPTGADDASVVNLNDLDVGTTDFKNVINGSSANQLLITEFVKSGLDVSATANNLEAIRYDENNFAKEGTYLKSNTSQIVNSDNAYATSITKIVDVVSGSSAIGTVLDLKGTDINGNPYDIQVNLSTPGSYVSGSTNGVAIANFDIFNTAIPRVGTHPDQMTYQQLNDVVNMVVTANIPAVAGTNIHPPVPPAVIGLPFTADEEYDLAISASKHEGEVSLDSEGKMVFKELNGSALTQASMSLSDATASNFFSDVKGDGSALSFQNNDALTITDPKNNFFEMIDEMIASVRAGKMRPDASQGTARDVGIQNSIQKISDLQLHVETVQAKAGVQSQSLQRASDRTEMLLISAQTLRSETIDTDIAESSLKLSQLNLNYQALLSTVSKVQQLSLVNYL